MKPTPITSHIDIHRVYEPAEDTFLLLDALEAETAYLHAKFKRRAPLVLELGTGSGIVTTFIHNSVLPQALFLAVDVNVDACWTCMQTSAANGGTKYLDCVRMSLCSGIRPKSVDLLVFNPPYVPSEVLPTTQYLSDSSKQWLDIALEGGTDGMQVTWQALQSLELTLTETGVAYILFCERNNPHVVQKYMSARNWNVHLVCRRKAGWEVLSVMRIEPSGNNKALRTAK